MQGPAVPLRCDAREPFGARGTGGAERRADLETRLECGAEQVGEVALGELGTDVCAVARFLEQVGVGVEGHAGAGVAKDAADLDDVKPDVDDQVAGEGVAEIMEAHPPTVAIESRSGGGSTQYPLRDVVVQERGAVRGCEDVIGAAGETRAALGLSKNGGELGEERNLAERSSRLGWDPVRRDAAAAARELVADVDDAGGEVVVVGC